MGKNAKLRLKDVRAVFRLVGDIRALGADPQVWRPHMVQSLRALAKADVVVSTEIYFVTAGRGAMKMVENGWGVDVDGNHWQIRSEREGESPETYWLSAGLSQDGGDEGEVVPITPTKPLHGGSMFILSQFPLPHVGAVDQLGLHRVWGDQPFTPAEHRLVRLFHVELGRLWRKEALVKARDDSTPLPPRLSQTLKELLAGSSEKQIAVKLQLSQHTVHNYVKALHQRFGVSSRGELLARVSKQQPDFRPKLSLEMP
jgi:DNA-binding CsgD family transcriptional regulator